MSCGLLIAASLFLVDPASIPADHAAPAAAEASISVASEPLFGAIVSRSSALVAQVDGWIAADAAFDADEFAAFKARTVELAALDMQGHVTLRERNIDGDLKCILRGIAEDMPVKVGAVEAAADADARRLALSDLRYLLNDNVEVVLAPPAPPV